MPVGAAVVGPGISNPSKGGGGGSGTVTSVGVTAGNGFAGTTANATTAARITLSTTIGTSGSPAIIKGNGTAISAAVSGTDYAPGTSGAATGLVVSTTGTGSFNTVAAPVGTVVGTTDTQTLTNKTLTAPVIATIVNTGTLTLPTSTDTLVGRATTDTLTNKRITPRTATTNAPGATPTTNSDNVDLQIFTGLATAITNMSTNLSGTPTNGQRLQIRFIDNGTPQTIAWGTGFVSGGTNGGATLPFTTTTSTPLDVFFEWNANLATPAWVCLGFVPGPGVVYQDLGTTNSGILSNTPTTIFNPTLTPGRWLVTGVAQLGGEATIAISYEIFLGSGGTASYSTSATGGNQPGAGGATAAAAAADNRIPVHFSFVVVVTAAGTILIQGVVATGGSGSPKVFAQDTATVSGTTYQVSWVNCIQLS